MSARNRAALARAHFERAARHLPNGDPVEMVTWLHLAADAAVTAAAEAEGIRVKGTHKSKVAAAEKLYATGYLPTNLGDTLTLLNEARREAHYEGEDPDLGRRSLDEIVVDVEEAVVETERLVRC